MASNALAKDVKDEMMSFNYRTCIHPSDYLLLPFETNGTKENNDISLITLDCNCRFAGKCFLFFCFASFSYHFYHFWAFVVFFHSSHSMKRKSFIWQLFITKYIYIFCCLWIGFSPLLLLQCLSLMFPVFLLDKFLAFITRFSSLNCLLFSFEWYCYCVDYRFAIH